MCQYRIGGQSDPPDSSFDAHAPAPCPLRRRGPGAEPRATNCSEPTLPGATSGERGARPRKRRRKGRAEGRTHGEPAAAATRETEGEGARGGGAGEVRGTEAYMPQAGTMGAGGDGPYWANHSCRHSAPLSVTHKVRSCALEASTDIGEACRRLQDHRGPARPGHGGLSWLVLAATVGCPTILGASRAASGQTAGDQPAASFTGPITVGHISEPLTAHPSELAANGYVEQEYFAHGTATVYRERRCPPTVDGRLPLASQPLTTRGSSCGAPRIPRSSTAPSSLSG